MSLKYWVQDCAVKSFDHRHEDAFLDWLSENAYEIIELDGEDDEYEISLADSDELRDFIIHGHRLITEEVLSKFDDALMDSFTEVGEEIASVGYDHYGMGHSGWNGVYEFCGLYLLTGSDYSEGPSEDKYELLKYLDFDNPDHEVFWSEYAD